MTPTVDRRGPTPRGSLLCEEVYEYLYSKVANYFCSYIKRWICDPQRHQIYDGGINFVSKLCLHWYSFVSETENLSEDIFIPVGEHHGTFLYPKKTAR